jgi:hypothetical protein
MLVKQRRERYARLFPGIAPDWWADRSMDGGEIDASAHPKVRFRVQGMDGDNRYL